MITEKQVTEYIQGIVDAYRNAREHELGCEEEFYGKELDYARRFVKELTGKSICIERWKVSLE